MFAMAAEQNREGRQSQSRWYVITVALLSARPLIKASLLRLKGSLSVNARYLFVLTNLAIEIEVAFTGNKPSTILRVEVNVGERRVLNELEDSGRSFRWEGNM